MKNLVLTLCTIISSIGFINGQTSRAPVGIATPIPLSVLGNEEIFRFAPGAVTQLQQGTDFQFGSNNRWFSLGQVTQGQTFYGSRFQFNERALVQGYSDAAPNTPRIQWIHNGGSTVGDLEFRVANSFTSTQSRLVATMTAESNTYFASTIPANFTSTKPKVGIVFEDLVGLAINTSNNLVPGVNRTGASIEVENVAEGNGLIANCFNGDISTGVFGKAAALEFAYGVRGEAAVNGNFSAGVYGSAGAPGSNNFAGFFDGDLIYTGSLIPSDRNLKKNINNEENILERISLLRPVTYNYQKTEGLALSSEFQHGFISQEMAEVFPELTKDITKPVFDEDGKIVSDLSFKAINYTGLISVLTAGIQELNEDNKKLNEQLQTVQQELEDLKAEGNLKLQTEQNTLSLEGYKLEQNVPNPFSDRSTITYKLAQGMESASISIFNLNGGFIKSYPIDKSQGQITVLASDIASPHSKNQSPHSIKTVSYNPYTKTPSLGKNLNVSLSS